MSHPCRIWFLCINSREFYHPSVDLAKHVRPRPSVPRRVSPCCRPRYRRHARRHSAARGSRSDPRNMIRAIGPSFALFERVQPGKDRWRFHSWKSCYITVRESSPCCNGCDRFAVRSLALLQRLFRSYRVPRCSLVASVPNFVLAIKLPGV